MRLNSGAKHVGDAVEASEQLALRLASEAIDSYHRMQTAADAVSIPAMAACNHLERVHKRLQVRPHRQTPPAHHNHFSNHFVHAPVPAWDLLRWIGKLDLFVSKG